MSTGHSNVPTAARQWIQSWPLQHPAADHRGPTSDHTADHSGTSIPCTGQDGAAGTVRHFLRLLQETIGHSTPLTVVAESEEAARHTVDQLWPTSKFNRYRLVDTCFSGLFSAPPGESEPMIDLILADKSPWVKRDPELGDFSDEPIEHVDPP
jgi:hypothetical protein